MAFTVLTTIAGAAVGYFYYRFVGCRSGTCPIWSHWYTATGYGAMLGLLLGRA
jgi:hypothetical protein